MDATERIVINRVTGESGEFPDHRIRLDAAVLTFKLLGMDIG